MKFMLAKVFLLSALLLLGGAGAEGAVLALGPVFNQDFSSSTQVTDYDNGGANQFDSIGGTGSTPSIVGGAFQISMTIGAANIGHATRTVTDFTGPPPVMVFKADMTLKNLTSNVAGNVGNNFAVGFQFGDNLNPTAWNVHQNVYSTFYLASAVGGNILLRSNLSGGNSSQFTAGTMLSVTFFMNNSGSSQNLLAPDNTTLTLGNDQVSLWVNTSLVQTYDAADPNQSLNSFGIYARSAALGGANPRNVGFDFTIDNMQFLAPIPEPSTIMLLLGGTLLIFCRRFIHHSTSGPSIS